MASSFARKEVVDNNDDYCHAQHREEEENDLGAESLTVPVIALKWTILNCDSNHELSTLSNICRSWRDIVSITLLEEEEEEEEKVLDEREEGKSGEDPDPPVSSLLLPSMMRQLALALASSSATATATAKEKNDTFCVSWFEPKGIQVDAVNPKDLDEYISSDESVDEHTSSNKRGNFSSSSSDFFMMQSYNNNNSNNMNGSSVNLYNTKSFISQQQYFPNSNNNNNHTTDSPIMKSPTNNNNNKNFSPKKVKKRSVTKSWEGNKSPMDVLSPFGFTNSFVNKIIAKVQESRKKSSKTGNMNHGFSSSRTTFAVRGATEARAEVIPTGDGLFFPLDTPIETLITDPSPLLTATTKKVIQSPPSLSLLSNLDSTSPQPPPPPLPSRLLDKDIRMQYKKDADLDRQNRKLKKLRRKLVKIQQKLPRVVLSTPNTSALGSRNVIPLKLRKRQKSVQFLNANGSRAVRMQTLPFECGPLTMPFTVFCVGIATEDGVFLSGLKKRFELGHLYPQNKVDEITEMSSVCIAFDDSETMHKNNHNDDEEQEQERETAMGSSLSNRSSDVYHEALGGYDRRNNIDNYGSSSGDETDDDDDAIGISGSFDEDDEDDIDSQPPLVCRGKTGPGLYHCYTAIFDGDQSVIRVDGAIEFDGSTIKKQSDNSSSARFLSFGEQNSSSSSSLLPPSSSSPPMLDGLTIGSDHRFDMSLCFGEGDPGEGEGAISELAVFKGRLPDIDLATIEKHMMKKHGIYRAPSTPTSEPNAANDTSKQDTDIRNTPTNTTTTIISPWHEDEWRRQAHALIVQPYPYVLSGKNVPLRFLSNHRSVAWHRSCDVTGTALRVSRIGSKLSNGSSDW